MTQSPARILIVDDEADVAHLLSVRFKSRGYATQCFYEGDGALETILSYKPDLLVLDLNLPGLSGIEIYQHLRAHPEGHNLPVLFFSADASQMPYCVETLRADGFIRKPYNPEEVMTLVADTLKKRKNQETAA